MYKSVVLICLCFLSLSVLSHEQGKSYLGLSPSGKVLEGELKLSVSDIRGLYPVLGGNIFVDHAWRGSELQRRLSEDVLVYRDGELCVPDIRSPSKLQYENGDFASFPVRFYCRARTGDVTVENHLLLVLETRHKMIVGLFRDDTSESVMLGKKNFEYTFSEVPRSFVHSFWVFVEHGVWHIWIGYDHILFLITLLLPSVFFRKSGVWVAHKDWTKVAKDVAMVISAFTLAHSVTLALSVLGVMSFPGKYMEATIAASVVVAACNVLYPTVNNLRWLMASVFGLIHGFGFAGVLNEITGFDQNSIALLLAFNIGVELGQVAIVCVLLPVLYQLRHLSVYRKVLMPSGASCVALIGCFWVGERLLS